MDNELANDEESRRSESAQGNVKKWGRGGRTRTGLVVVLVVLAVAGVTYWRHEESAAAAERAAARAAAQREIKVEARQLASTACRRAAAASKLDEYISMVTDADLQWLTQGQLPKVTNDDYTRLRTTEEAALGSAKAANRLNRKWSPLAHLIALGHYSKAVSWCMAESVAAPE